MNNKISLLIYSYDRAAQLDLLLRSIERNAPDEYDIHVIFRYSNDDFYEGYLRIFEGYPYVGFTNEVLAGSDCKGMTLGVLRRDLGVYKYVSIATDDCILFKKPYLDEIKFCFDEFPGVVGAASLRLGLDTKIETYFTNTKVPPLNYEEVGPELIAWGHRDYPPMSCWGYTNSIDMTLWKLDDIFPLINDLNFRNPNDLEGGLSLLTHKLNPVMIAGREQVAVASPVNGVSSYNNRAGDSHPFSTKELNERFLSGEKICLDSAIEFLVNKENLCTHVEINYQFVSPGDRE